MSGISVRDDGVALVFEVRVAARASRDRIMGVREGALKVALTAPPVDGAANDALRKMLAKALGVPKSCVEIVRGERSRQKLVRVRDVDADEIDAPVTS